MKPPGFAYHDPQTIAETVALLGSLENARLLAGGQSLMPMLAMRVALPDHLIDLNRVAGLDGIVVEHGTLRIGAMTRQRSIEASTLVSEACPLMTEALHHVGHIQTRNRGTIGGSLCHLDPSAELVTVAAALDATIKVAGPEGLRDLAIADFPLGFMTPALAESEMVVGIRLGTWPSGHGYCFTEFARRHGDYAIVSAAALLLPDASGRVTRASVTLGGVGAAPLRVVAAEAALIGEVPTPALLRAAAAYCDGIDAMEDPQAPAWYRRRLAAVLTRRALERAWARAIGEAA